MRAISEMEAASLIRPPDSPADATPPDETLAPRPPMRKRRSSMVPVFRKPRGIAENLEKAMVGSSFGPTTQPFASRLGFDPLNVMGAIVRGDSLSHAA